MLDRVTGMQVFCRVAALGSFSAAGRALGLSQTGVTSMSRPWRRGWARGSCTGRPAA
ncbi:hypothetical protein Mext_4058 [Methylorubrum extorquens PA1]|nr:hypothetical protein Mext_4058 [Methylorubrum extorquens PA1]